MLLTGCATGQPVVAPEPTAWKIVEPPRVEGRAYSAPDETAPLSKWTAANTLSYPTQNECEQALEKSREEARQAGADLLKALKTLKLPPSSYEKARCVSIDDPDLKSNSVSN
jgi:hypothetical protein